MRVRKLWRRVGRSAEVLLEPDFFDKRPASNYPSRMTLLNATRLPGIAFGRTTELCRKTAKVGVGVYSVGSCFSTPPKIAGLLLGYAALTETQVTHGIRRLATVLS